MSTKLKLVLFISFLYIVAVGNLFFIHYIKDNGSEKLKWVNHTHEVIIETKNYLSAMQDAETGQRGYLLTKDNSYLEPYSIGINSAKKSFEKLKILTSDNSIQQKRLESINDSMKLKFKELDKTIILTQNNNSNKALEIVKQNNGKLYMDEIRTYLDEFINIEMVLLKKRKADLKEQTSKNIFIIKIISLLLVSILFYFLYGILNQKNKLQNTVKEKTKKLAISNNRLHELNENLEEIVEEKTEKLQELNENLEQVIKIEIEKNRQSELQIFEQAKMVSMGEMIGNIAHQWRQPLSAISSASSGLQVKQMLGTLNEEVINDLTKAIDESTQYLSKTIDTFRDFIKEEKVLKEVVLQDRIDITLSIINASLNSSHIKLVNNIDYADPIKLMLVVGELSQVIINILNNAKDILLERDIKNPWIELNLIKEDNKAIITIEDNGDGIPEDILPKIFDPYFTTKHKSQGTGLGLHMSYKIIVDSLKGSLYAKNTSNGAKFFIELQV